MNEKYIKVGVLYLIIVSLLTILLIIFNPEKKKLEKEKERLIQVEEKIIEAINNEDTLKVKSYLPQLRFQFVGSSIEKIKETEKLTKIWDSKRKEYSKIIEK